jgi:hydrogenase maturation factor HypF (carbamoyltransferase family)
MLEYRLSERKDDRCEAASIGVIGIQANEKIMERAVYPVAQAALLILQGKIIALKGVGGYNFVCSPFDEMAVKKLRRLKIREEKPFAVMFRDMEQIRKYCHVSPEEEALLLSSARPIFCWNAKRRLSHRLSKAAGAAENRKRKSRKKYIRRAALSELFSQAWERSLCCSIFAAP